VKHVKNWLTVTYWDMFIHRRDKDVLNVVYRIKNSHRIIMLLTRDSGIQEKKVHMRYYNTDLQ
jgi:hypothetical protein